MTQGEGEKKGLAADLISVEPLVFLLKLRLGSGETIELHQDELASLRTVKNALRRLFEWSKRQRHAASGGRQSDSAS